MSLRKTFNTLFGFTKYRMCTRDDFIILKQAKRSPYEIIARREEPDAIQTIFDVGANVGQTTRVLRSYFRSPFIHAFEPTPESCDQFMRLHAADPKVRLWPLALSKSEGTLDFYVNKKSMTNSLLPVWEASREYINKEYITNVDIIKVDVKTINSFCKDQNISRIDILKIDVQGSELDVLVGASDLLDTRSIKYICLEAPFVNLYHHQAFFYEIDHFLRSHGYTVYNIFQLARHEDDRLLFADVLFMLEE